MLKRSGFGSRPNDIVNMKTGDLAVECPACPHPSKNLREGWSTEENKYVSIQTNSLNSSNRIHHGRWAHSQFKMLDGNFKQSHRAKDTDDDTDLADGCAYFVRNKEYKEFLETQAEEKVV